MNHLLKFGEAIIHHAGKSGIPDTRKSNYFHGNTWLISNRILDKFAFGIPNATMQQSLASLLRDDFANSVGRMQSASHAFGDEAVREKAPHLHADCKAERIPKSSSEHVFTPTDECRSR